MKNDVYKRIARAEAMAAAQNAELMETLRAAYERACDEGNEEDAANYARKIRNRLLDESDFCMCLDRLGLEMPSGSTCSAWLPFLHTLAEGLIGSWAAYRQALRDLPEQEGFPLNVVFPVPPDNTAAEVVEDE